MLVENFRWPSCVLSGLGVSYPLCAAPVVFAEEEV